MSIPHAFRPLGAGMPRLAKRITKKPGYYLLLDNDIPAGFTLTANVENCLSGSYILMTGHAYNTSDPRGNMLRLGRGNYWSLYYNTSNNGVIATGSNSSGLFTTTVTPSEATTILPSGQQLKVRGNMVSYPFFLFAWYQINSDGSFVYGSSEPLDILSADIKDSSGKKIYELRPLADNSGMWCLVHRKKYAWRKLPNY